MSGIAEAKTEWVLFGEDDVWLSPDYCSTLLREAEQLGASIIAGTNRHRASARRL